MKHSQSGMVLLTTIMMIVILTLLILSLMQGVCLYIKSSNQVVINHQVVYKMEEIANKLDLTQPECLVQDKNPNQLVDFLLNGAGCMYEDSHQYKYVLEDLGLHPCLKILQEQTVYGSHHWLITLATTGAPNVVLQLRLARPAETAICKLSTVSQIPSGVISWRKINVLLDTNKMHDKIFD